MDWDNFKTEFLNIFGTALGQNTYQDYLFFIGIFVSVFLVFLIIDKFILVFLNQLAKKTKTPWDDYVVSFLGSFSWLFYVYASLFVSSMVLQLPVITRDVLGFLFIIFLAYYIGKGVSKIVDRLVEKKILEKKSNSNLENSSMIKVLGIFGKVFIWVLILLTVLSNLGVEITPLIAGLGVGGIAIALALQVILGDLFNAFVIYFDKPFKEGDFIIVGSDMGVVKEIGIKTTRIAALSGQELIMSNSDLTNSRINNYKKMERRRVPFSFGVTYNTPAKKLEKIKKIVGEILLKTNKKFGSESAEITLDRVHFKSFGDSSLDYEVVYYVPTADFNVYMDVQEYINLELVKVFEKEEIEFAFPTRTVYMEKR